jgi:hypothetical protein
MREQEREGDAAWAPRPRWATPSRRARRLDHETAARAELDVRRVRGNLNHQDGRAGADCGADRRALLSTGKSAHQRAHAGPSSRFRHITSTAFDDPPLLIDVGLALRIGRGFECELMGMALPPWRSVSKVKEKMDWPPSFAPDFDSVILPSTTSPAR